MSEWKEGDPPMRLGFDARHLTPRQDTLARSISLEIGRYLTDSVRVLNDEIAPEKMMEILLLYPYALMYAMKAAIEGAKAVPVQGNKELERLAAGMWNRDA